MKLKEMSDDYIRQELFDGVVILGGNVEKSSFLFCNGLADRISGKHFDEHTVIDISSVSKPLGTATSAVICMSNGLLDPEQDFRKYVPDFAGQLAYPINLIALGTHTSGFQANYPLDCTAQVMLDAMKHSNSARPPFSFYEYQCLNFHILGWAVENVSGQKLDVFAKNNIFEPLHMNDTSWGFPLTHTFDRLARTARHMDNPPSMIFDRWARVLYPRICGNAGIFSSASDLALFAQMMLRHGDGMLKEPFLELLYKTLTAPGLLQRSFGWNKDRHFIPPSFSADTIFHTGSSGQSCWIDPVSGHFLIVLTNLFGDHNKAIDARFALACQAAKAL